MKWQEEESRKNLSTTQGKIFSRLLRRSTARGSSTRLFRVGTTKVKACRSFLFTDSPLKVENKEHLVDLVVTLFIFIHEVLSIQ